MKLSRKRKRELKRLRKQTQELLDHQRDVLGHAGVVLGEAGHQAKQLGNEHVMPRVEHTAERVRPVVRKNLDCARRAADRVKVATTPILAAALASTVHSLDRIEQREASKKLQNFGSQVGILEKPKKKRVGRFFAISAGIAAAGAVGYSLWQALREDDDDMWVSSDDF